MKTAIIIPILFFTSIHCNSKESYLNLRFERSDFLVAAGQLSNDTETFKIPNIGNGKTFEVEATSLLVTDVIIRPIGLKLYNGELVDVSEKKRKSTTIVVFWKKKYQNHANLRKKTHFILEYNWTLNAYELNPFMQDASISEIETAYKRRLEVLKETVKEGAK